MSIEKSEFGMLPEGMKIDHFTLVGPGGLRIGVITYGGIITRIEAPGRDGQRADVCLGKDSIEEYLAGHPYFGALIGRVAGRLSGGRFTLDGVDHELARNDPPNHLHGGLIGFDKRVWSAEALENASGGPSLRLGYFSPDGEEGYPGNVRVLATYTVTADNALVIEFEAETDRPTPLSLTNHTYFNLSGHDGGPVHDHLLTIHADEFVPTDRDLTLTGERCPVDGRPNDFRRPRRLGDAIAAMPHDGHGDNYLIRDGGRGREVPVAEVTDPSSGRTMAVTSTAGSLQLYTSAMLDDGTAGKAGAVYNQYQALCLECQRYPDGVNAPHIEDNVLRPGERHIQRTTYRFSA